MPVTTISGLIGILGSIMVSIATLYKNEPWASIVGAIGAALVAGNGVGNIYAAEDRDVIKKPSALKRD